MDPIASQTKQKIQKVLDIIKGDLATLRTGRATPALVENIVISAYGGSTKLKLMELATIGTADSQTLVITPFDPSIIGEIQKGIMDTNIGLTPIVDGNLMRISIPPLSEERRKELIKAMKHKLENGKIMVRQIRHEAMEQVNSEFAGREDDIKRLEKEIQKLIDDTMTQIEEMGKHKEQELMQI